MGKHKGKPQFSAHKGSKFSRKFKQGREAGRTDGKMKGKSKSSAPDDVETSTTSESVYKRVPSYPKLFTQIKNYENFITSSHPQYQQLVKTSYEGFLTEDGSHCGADFDTKFQLALENLDKKEIYMYDMTQPAGLGTKIAKTFVTRCLVGEAGMTYKYLGLRMFAHPWNEGALGTNEDFVSIGQLNQALIARSQGLLKDLNRKTVGSCQYNLTLINRCHPEGTIKLKKEPLFDKEHCTVSWHADSSLEHYSSIAVYHYQRQPTQRKAWRIALKVHINAEGPQQAKPVSNASQYQQMPPVEVALPQQACYYMFDDFNHHHQHSVLVGDSHRFASTHRVSLQEGHSYAYIQQRYQSLNQEKISCNKKYIRKLGLLLLEVEMEWVRQFYIQGAKHRDIHPWWHEPMQQLEDVLYQCEGRLCLLIRTFQAVQMGATSYRAHTEGVGGLGSAVRKKISRLVHDVDRESLEEMIEQLTELVKKREGWEGREGDSVYKGIEEELRPIPLPSKCFQPLKDLAVEYGIEIPEAGNSHSYLPRLVERVQDWLQKYDSNK